MYPQDRGARVRAPCTRDRAILHHVAAPRSRPDRRRSATHRATETAVPAHPPSGCPFTRAAPSPRRHALPHRAAGAARGRRAARVCTSRAAAVSARSPPCCATPVWCRRRSIAGCWSGDPLIPAPEPMPAGCAACSRGMPALHRRCLLGAAERHQDGTLGLSPCDFAAMGGVSARWTPRPLRGRRRSRRRAPGTHLICGPLAGCLWRRQHAHHLRHSRHG